MTIVRVGSNDKYANGWSAAFGKGGAKKQAAAPAAKSAPKKAAKKKAKAGKKK